MVVKGAKTVQVTLTFTLTATLTLIIIFILAASLSCRFGSVPSPGLPSSGCSVHPQPAADGSKIATTTMAE